MPINRETWPAEYDLEERDGKAVLPMDFFPTTSAGQLDLAWVERTVKYRPYFEPAAVQSGIVNKDHQCGKNNPANVANWLKMVKNRILGKPYRERMKSGWNSAMESLTSESGYDGPGPDFTYEGRQPITQADRRAGPP